MIPLLNYLERRRRGREGAGAGGRRRVTSLLSLDR